MTERTLKPKRCKACGNLFRPISTFAKACGPVCAIQVVQKAKERAEAKAKREERAATRAAKERVKTRGEHLRELQAAFNAWIRLRDAEFPCISCGRPALWRGQWDAGHYLSRGSSPALRFDPANVHKQCLPCNRHLSGNLIAFRVGLIQRIGLERVEWLEGPHDPKKLSLAEIQEMKAFYRSEVRRMKKEAA
jgi:predicted RNA-binding Zn-ribbon protein involved in translation (DUF1610 family)